MVRTCNFYFHEYIKKKKKIFFAVEGFLINFAELFFAIQESEPNFAELTFAILLMRLLIDVIERF